MSNVIEFKIGEKDFIIYEAPALEMVDLILAVQELGSLDESSDLEFKINRKNYKEFASILLQTTFIVQRLGDGTDLPVTKSTFVGLKDTQDLMAFIAKVIEILMTSAAPVLEEVNEKKTESTDSSGKRTRAKIRSVR